ncbi:uncharacterized protein FTOL_12620 [Fusarium torulosum]|uniref:B30.2/SPRY domain-containing protein n=1 Tax=Fusarium torulosum TaxID=33205 RepID=A0AAE8MM12_9HYPO|nr:uncharacterized protein FTOL_12620 [Fusarium torulosum]
MATAVSAADDAEFAFNLLSDIAPVLALFGEQFARQFMSESLIWYDHLIFAMVPLGIITAITGAIRVHGPQVARSFIGRARETRALSEIELMSSTSQEVCELFNGSSIIRAMGRPKITQFLIFPKHYDNLEGRYKKFDFQLRDTEPVSEPEDRSCGIHSLESVISKDVELMKFGRYQSLSTASFQEYVKRTLRFFGSITSREKTPESDTEGQKPKASTDAKCYNNGLKATSQPSEPPQGPPNLQLNLSSDYEDQGWFKKGGEIILAAIVAFFLQTGVIAFAGVTTYYLSPRYPDLLESKIYGFPCYVAGSILLSIGTGLCSIIVEHSTIEHCWELVEDVESPKGDAPRKKNQPRLVWIQQNQTVNDQGFSGFVILAGAKPHVITSRRNPVKRPQYQTALKPQSSQGTAVSKTSNVEEEQDSFWEWLTVAAALSAGIGFTAQFMGLRGLAFPCSIAQLLGVFVMALIRAGVRRRLGRVPVNYHALSGHELDFLATQIALSPKFRNFLWYSKEKVGQPETERPRSEPCQWKISAPNPGQPTPFLFRAPEKLMKLESPEYSGFKDDKSPSSQQLVRVRERLGDLCAWTSRSSESALSLAQSIELFMNTFFPISTGNKEDNEDDQAMKSFKWLIEATKPTTTKTYEEHDFIQILVENPAAGGKKSWKVDIGKIDAALSLWMATIEKERSHGTDQTSEPVDFDISADQSPSEWRRTKVGDDPNYTFCRIVGDNLEDEALKRDISWWVDSFVAEQCDPLGQENDYDDNQQRWNPARNNDADLVIGFSGTSDNGILIPTHDKSKTDLLICIAVARELAIASKASLPVILAQHLFTSFMWTIASRLPKNILTKDQHEIIVDGSQTFDSYSFGRTWLRAKLSHRKLSTTVRKMESFGLGSSTDILLCIIPALSSQRILPSQEILKFMPRVGPEQGWGEVAICYKKLLETVKVGKVAEDDRFNASIFTAAMDFVFLATEPYDELIKPSTELDEELKNLVQNLIGPRFSGIMEKLVPFYRLQRRQRMLRGMLQRFQALEGMSQCLEIFERDDPLDEIFAKNVVGFTPKHLKARSTIGFFQFIHSVRQTITKGEKDSEERDIFGCTPYYYCCLLEDMLYHSFFLWTLQERVRGLIKLVDNLGRSPIHIAAREGMHQSLEQVFGELSNEGKRHVARTSGLDGMTYLHLIARSGDLACLELITPWVKPLLSKPDSWGRHPLHIAAKFENYDFALKLLEMGARFDRVDETGRTPLDYYVDRRKDRSGKSDEVPLGTNLFEKFLDLAIEDPHCLYSNGKTFLHSAIEISDERTIHKLLQKFRIEARDNDERTALHYAILAGRSSMAQALIKGKVYDQEMMAADTSTPDAHNMTPLMMAVKNNLVEVAELLLDWLGLKSAHENDKHDKTMLHYAGGMDIAKCLIGKGWSPLTTDPDGRTALHVAISARNEPLALYLFEVDRVQQDPFDKHKESLLVTACKSGASAVDPRIISKFPKIINVEDEEYHKPPISWACWNGHSVIVKTLVDHNEIDVNMAVELPDRDKYGRFKGYTPLHFAVQAKSGLCVEQLLRHPDINLGLMDEFDQTPLQMARDGGCQETARLLLQDKQTTDEERMSFVKEFVYCSSSVFYHIVSDVLGSFQNKGLVHKFMLWLADSLATTHLPTSLTLFGDRLKEGSWNELSLPYHVAILLDDVDLVKRLREHHVNEEARDEDNWSWVDYARRFDRNNKFTSLVRDMQSLQVHAEPTALVSTDLPNSIEITACRAYGHINCSQAHDVRVTEEIEDEQYVCMRSKHCVSPYDKSFYFEIEIHNDSVSHIVGIGFCGANNDKNEFPGWRHRSWGYHGNDGGLYIEGNQANPSSDFGESGTFASGDVVGVCLNTETGQGFCTRNGKMLKMGNAFKLPDRRFNYGKLYPCVWLFLGPGGMGLHFTVNFGNTELHPFKYPGSFEFI